MNDHTLRSALDPDRLAPEPADPAVGDVMRQEVVFCLPSTPIDAIAKLLADNDLDELPVLLDRRPVGYVRAADILDRLVAGDVAVSGSDLIRSPITAVQARDVLRTPALLVDERQRVGEVVELMNQQARTSALVMHEDETPVGLLTTVEIADHLLAALPTPAVVHA
ncbi:MAG: CBS domain-containing protein [Candidatus Dormibacteria bacterium]